jgi:hypothetical protein
MTKIDALLMDYEPGHTPFQIKNFIVGAEVHPWHRYKQCLREIAGRRESIESGTKTIKRLEARIGRLRRKIFKTRKARYEAEDLIEQKLKLVRKMQNIAREMSGFAREAISIKSRHNFGQLSIEQKKILEFEAWREKAKFMLCMDLFCTGRPTKQTIEFIYKLPREAKRELLMEVDPSNQKKIIEYLIE